MSFVVRSIVKLLVDEMQGSIEVESHVGKGWFVLDL